MNGELEYTGLMAEAWDLLRGDTSDWPDRAFFLRLAREVGGPVLDVGCGTGRLLLDFLALGIDIDGVDISPDMIAILRAKASASGLDLADRVHIGAMEDLDLPRHYQLVIVPSASIQLVLDPDDVHAAMRRFFALLEPGGTLAMAWLNIGRDHVDSAVQSFVREATAGDGAVIRRTCRAWFDAATDLESTDDLYEKLRDGVVVTSERQIRDPATRNYSRDAIEALHTGVGFDLPQLLHVVTWEPSRDGDRSMMSVARRLPA